MPPKRKLEALGAEVSTPKKSKIRDVNREIGEYNYHAMSMSIRVLTADCSPHIYQHWTDLLNDPLSMFVIPDDFNTEGGFGSLLNDFLKACIPNSRETLAASNAFFEALVKRDTNKVMMGHTYDETPLELVARTGRCDLTERLLAICPEMALHNSRSIYENPLAISIANCRDECTVALCKVTVPSTWVQNAFQMACLRKYPQAFTLLTVNFAGWCHPDGVTVDGRSCFDLVDEVVKSDDAEYVAKMTSRARRMKTLLTRHSIVRQSVFTQMIAESIDLWPAGLPDIVLDYYGDVCGRCIGLQEACSICEKEVLDRRSIIKDAVIIK